MKMRRLLIFIVLVMGLGMLNAESMDVACDSIVYTAPAIKQTWDTTRDNGYWKRALRHLQLDINDTTVKYPSFIDFCVNVYRWGDRTFNGYDSTYVVSTNKKWKLMVKNNNWFSTLNGELNNKEIPFLMHSNFTSSFGGSISYMALSLYYMFNLNDLITGHKVKYKKFDLSFTCSRIYFNAFYNEDSYPYYIHKLGDDFGSDLKDYKFHGVSRFLKGLNVCYIFNNRRYAQAASYCFSKYQRKSAGSFIAGLHIFQENVSMNFDQLREEFPNTSWVDDIRYKYNGYSLLFGYGYNWVLGKNWLYNITAIPGFGMRKTYSTSSEGAMTFWSFDYRAKMAIILNRGNFFYGLHLLTDGRWYLTHQHSVFNSSHELDATVGFRF